MKQQNNRKIKSYAVLVVYFLFLILVPILWFKNVKENEFFYIHDQSPLLKAEQAESITAWDTRWLGTDGGMFVTKRANALRFLILNNAGLSVKQSQLVVFTLLFSLPGMFMYVFLKNLLEVVFENEQRNKIMLSSLIGSLLYASNLYLIILWHAGHYTTMGMVYALAPAILHFIINVYFKGGNPVINGLLIGLLFFIIGPAIPPNTAAMFLVIIPLFIISLCVFSFNKDSFIKLLTTLTIAFVLSIIFNLWWVLPYLKTLLFTSKDFVNNDSTNLTYVSLTAEPAGFLRRIQLYMKWTFDASWNGRAFHSFYSFYKKLSVKTVWFLFIIFIFSPFLYKKEDANKNKLMVLSFSGLVFTTSLLLSKGIKNPFSYIFVFLYENVPFFKMFRSPGNKFGGPLMLSMSILASVSSYLFLQNKVDKNTSKLKVIAVTSFSVFAILLYSFPLISGAALKEKQEGGMPDNITFVNKDYEDFSKYVNSQQEDFRIIFLPEGSNYGVFAPNNNLKFGYEGSDMLQKLISKPVIYSPNNTRTNVNNAQVAWQIYDSNNNNVLRYMNVKYIVFRDDYYNFDCGHICENILEKLPAEKTGQYESLRVYEIDKSLYLRRFYLADQVEVVKNSHSFFKDVANNPDLKTKKSYLAEDQNVKKDLKLTINNNSKNLIEFKKIKDSRYLINISTDSDTEFLVFQEGFNKDWKLYQVKNTFNEKYLIKKFLAEDYLKEDLHYITNAYANGWLLNIEKLCENGSCEKDASGNYSITLLADYWPNWLYTVGSVVSMGAVTIVVVGLVIYFIIQLWKKKTT